MRNIFFALLLLIGIPAARADSPVSYGPGNLRFLIEAYTGASNRAVICELKIPNLPMNFKFDTTQNKAAKAIAAHVLEHYGMEIIPLDDHLSVLEWTHRKQFESVAEQTRKSAAKIGGPLLPAVIVAGGMRFTYKLEAGSGDTIAEEKFPKSE